jgi:hypothetical protein
MAEQIFAMNTPIPDGYLCVLPVYQYSLWSWDIYSCAPEYIWDCNKFSCEAGSYREGCGGETKSSYGTCAACQACAIGQHLSSCGTPPISSGSCITCAAGTYSSDGFASCASCGTGKFSNTPQSGACETCKEGYFSANMGATVCKACDTSLCPFGSVKETCTIHSDSKCKGCMPPMDNCVYSSRNTCNLSDGRPACLCKAGFEMKYLDSRYKCVQCQPGKYKSEHNSAECRDWEPVFCNSDQYVANGTSTHTSTCLNLPSVPDNAHRSSSGPQWICNSGFEINTFWRTNGTVFNTSGV